jgi:type I restriction enzyme R subunit
MSESETRAELIDPKLKEKGWDGKNNLYVEVRREYHITAGIIKDTSGRVNHEIANYVNETSEVNDHLCI